MKKGSNKSPKFLKIKSKYPIYTNKECTHITYYHPQSEDHIYENFERYLHEFTIDDIERLELDEEGRITLHNRSLT